MKTTYTLERKWPHSGRWAYVPEHGNITLEHARRLIAQDRHFEREEMQQRIVATSHRVVHFSKSRPYPAATLSGIRNLRGY